MNLLSLFSGCGGMDIGFEGDFICLKKSINEVIHSDWIKKDLGNWVLVQPTIFKTIFANDIRPDAKAAWVSYFKRRKDSVNQIYHLESIVNLVKRAKNGEDIFPKNVDIVTGGFPCQDFSIAGKRLGFNSSKSHMGTKITEEATEENRGKLYMWMKEVITLTEPKMFIAENVKGLANLDDVKEIIEKDFSTAGNGGYLVVPAKVLYAPYFGVPQSRERIFFFGFKKAALTIEALKALSQEIIPSEFDPYPIPTHGNSTSKPIVTCFDIFCDLEEPDDSNDLSQKHYSKAKFMGAHCQGQAEIKINGVAPTIRAEHHGNIEFRRLSLEHGGKIIEELNRGLKERRLSIRECARIQTFPNDYQFILEKTEQNVAVSASDAYKIIGNAVPCLLAYNIAKNIENKWLLYFKES